MERKDPHGLPKDSVSTASARCSGESGRPHDPIELVLSGPGPAVCPRCGRQFKRPDAGGTVSPAVWPRDG